MFSFERAKTKGRKKQRREKGDPFSFSLYSNARIKKLKMGKGKMQMSGDGQTSGGRGTKERCLIVHL